MSASLLVYCVGVVTCPGLYPIAKETASASPTLCTEYGPDGWMDGSNVRKTETWLSTYVKHKCAFVWLSTPLHKEDLRRFLKANILT